MKGVLRLLPRYSRFALYLERSKHSHRSSVFMDGMGRMTSAGMILFVGMLEADGRKNTTSENLREA